MNSMLWPTAATWLSKQTRPQFSRPAASALPRKAAANAIMMAKLREPQHGPHELWMMTPSAL
jgi:hypothetical protein